MKFRALFIMCLIYTVGSKIGVQNPGGENGFFPYNLKKAVVQGNDEFRIFSGAFYNLSPTILSVFSGLVVHLGDYLHYVFENLGGSSANPK